MQPLAVVERHLAVVHQAKHTYNDNPPAISPLKLRKETEPGFEPPTLLSGLVLLTTGPSPVPGMAFCCEMAASAAIYFATNFVITDRLLRDRAVASLADTYE